MSKNGKWLPWFVGGGVLVLAGSVAMYTVDDNTARANVYGYGGLLGLGA